jgi:hypothetical protein
MAAVILPLYLQVSYFAAIPSYGAGFIQATRYEMAKIVVRSYAGELPILKSESADRFETAGTGLRFFASVVAYGQKLRGSRIMDKTGWSQIES